jgi:hypothetical protein
MTITIRPRWSLGRGKTLVPARWQATTPISTGSAYQHRERRMRPPRAIVVDSWRSSAARAMTYPPMVVMPKAGRRCRDPPVPPPAEHADTTPQAARSPKIEGSCGGRPATGLTISVEADGVAAVGSRNAVSTACGCSTRQRHSAQPVAAPCWRPTSGVTCTARYCALTGSEPHQVAAVHDPARLPASTRSAHPREPWCGASRVGYRRRTA